MKKLILLTLFVLPAAFAQENDVPLLNMNMETEIREFTARKSHWLLTMGMEGLKYRVPFAFDGVKKDFETEDRELWGGRIGYGREFYLGKGFMTSTRIEGYYLGTLFTSRQTANPEVQVDVAYTKDSGQIWGGDVIQTLSFLFDMKTKNPFMDEWTYLTVEPFVEAGIGRAKAFNKKDFKYDLTTNERYEQSFTDELTNVKFGAGVNLISSKGYFLYLKATQNRYDITGRKTDGYQIPSNGSRTALNNSGEETDLGIVTVYAMGGGYKF